MSTVGLQGRALGAGVVLPQHIARAKWGQYTYCSFQQQGSYVDNVGYGSPTSTSGNVSRGFLPSELGGSLPIVYYNNGTQTIVAPTWNVNGLVVSGDLTDTEGVGYVFGADDNVARGKHVYQINHTQGSATVFFAKLTWTIADVSGVTTSVFGFRKVQAFQTALTGYTDLACCGLVDTTGNVSTRTRLNNGTAVVVDTGYDWADAGTHTVEIQVNQAGQAKIIYDTYVVLNNTFTFDADDYVIPFFSLLHATTSPGAMTWSLFESGWKTNKSVDAPF